MQPQSKNPNFIQQISSIMPHFCDKCGAKHDQGDLEFVFNDTAKAMCKLSCKNCGNMYMIHINSPMDGMLSAKRSSFKSEISAKEMNKFSGSPRIESDEILDVFNALKGIKNIEDFNKHF